MSSYTATIIPLIFAVFLSVKVGAPAGGRKFTATTFRDKERLDFTHVIYRFTRPVVAAAAPLLIAITLLCNVVAVHPYVCRSAVYVSAWGAVFARRCPWSPNRSITSSPAVELMTLASVQQRLNRSDLYANDVMMRPHRWGGSSVSALEHHNR